MELPAPKSILLVEDDEAQLLMLSTFLRRNRYRVVATTNPMKALQLLETEKVDLVITDYLMPHSDGISLAEQVHALPGKRDLPIIMISGHSTEEVSERGMRRGVAMTLEKPVQLSKLLDLVGFATS